jgi:hypothetical protein
MRNEHYLAFVRARPCCLCACPGPSDPHHFGAHGTSIKCDDLFTVPLCRACHDEWHRSGRHRGRNRSQVMSEFWREAALLLVEWIHRNERQR